MNKISEQGNGNQVAGTQVKMEKNIITVKCKLSEKECNWSADLTRQLRENVLEQIHWGLHKQDFYSWGLSAIYTYNSRNKIITFKIKTSCDLSGINLEALAKTIKFGLWGVFYLDDVIVK